MAAKGAVTGARRAFVIEGLGDDRNFHGRTLMAEQITGRAASRTESSRSMEAINMMPSRVSSPAAKRAMTAEARDPKVGMISMKGMKSVSPRISKATARARADERGGRPAVR